MPDRPVRKAHVGTVTRVETLTPHMVRVVVGGPDVAALACGQFTDHYVKALFPPPGVSYPEPFDVAAIRESRPRDEWPVTRTYTIRRFLPDSGEMWVDFVVHGDEGIAGPWAAGARPGDQFRFMGPGGAYAPDPAADWHLLAGDESALPAIAATLEGLPADARARVFLEVTDPAEEQKLETAADAEITWLYRGDRPVGELLVPSVRAYPFPAGDPQVFVHGEANLVNALRSYLKVERGLPMDRLSISGYWRLGLNEDGWQSTKREWNQQVSQEQNG
jgi:NADPH-dependent ferric siderophore reductase